MRILFFSDNFPPESNALTARLYEHAMYWIKAGHQVTVVTCAPNFPEGKLMAGYKNRWRQVEDMDGIRVVRVKTYMSANKGFLKRMIDFMSFMVVGAFFGMFERKPDVVVATSPQFFCALGGMAVALLRRKPFVLEVRDLWPDSIVALGAMRRNALIRSFECMERFLYRRADSIVAVTQGVQRGIIDKGIDPGKVHLVINGVELSLYGASSSDREMASNYDLKGKFVVGYLGTHGLAYALNEVLDAAKLLEARSDIAFFFAGSGINREAIEMRAKSMRLTNVRMVPRQPKEMMPALWDMCSVALIPLKANDFFSLTLPAKMFEAMGSGVPLLFSGPRGEATEIIEETGAGICMPPEDPQALADAICRLADDPLQVKEMRDAARVAAPAYSRQVQAMRMEDVLRAVSA